MVTTYFSLFRQQKNTASSKEFTTAVMVDSDDDSFQSRLDMGNWKGRRSTDNLSSEDNEEEGEEEVKTNTNSKPNNDNSSSENGDKEVKGDDATQKNATPKPGRGKEQMALQKQRKKLEEERTRKTRKTKRMNWSKTKKSF